MAMKMRTASPYWLSLVLGGGLLFLFLGERLAPVESVRVVLTGIGVTAILLVTAARAWTASSTTGSRRRVERVLLGCHLATVLGIVFYILTTGWGPDSLATPNARGALLVLMGVALIASIIPVILIEIALGAALRTRFDIQGEATAESDVDFMRTRDSAWSGLTLAFAMSLLMVTCRVAQERNIVRDVSYFKTSLAGESTQNIVRASPEPIHAYLFFGDTEAKEYIRGYFEQLAADTNNLEVTMHDRSVDADLAERFKVSKDYVIVLARGTKNFNIELSEKEMKDAESIRKSNALRTLDGRVNKELLKLARDKRKAYVMVGHGELNDPDSIPPEYKGRIPERRTTKFKQQLTDLNYEIKELGLIDLAKDVPDDATLVIMLAPTSPLQPAEWDALARYLDKGGRLMIALDPKADPSLGSLEGKLGIKMHPGDLTDDKAYLPQRGTPADRRFAITTQFSAHASTTALSRTVDKGLILIDAGALDDAPFTDSPPPKKTVTLRSMESSFMDTNNNFSFDDGVEKRQKWNIGVAVEGKRTADGKDGFRALVYADADLFADAFVQNALRQAAVILVSGPLLKDSVNWLGGEEVFAGEIITEEDKPIEHTRNEEAGWFILTIVGVPLAVLAIGLSVTLSARTRTRKRAQPRKQEVQP